MTRWSASTSRPFQLDASGRISLDAQTVRLLQGSKEALHFARQFAGPSVRPPLGQGRSHYDHNQPRVPAGHPDGGQWTTAGIGGVRLAAREKPGPGILLAAITKFFLNVIDAYRSENGFWDLFGYRHGTVAVATINGKHVFGSNSNSPTYTRQDQLLAERLRQNLIQKYPDVMKRDNLGEKPNDALFHAETTVLLRAARESGGTLAGQTIEVFADRPLCISCKKVLPYVGLELGNPTVTFVGPDASRKTMRNGSWIN
jgi:hypothetical protein